MSKLLAFIIVLIIMLLDWSSTRAFEFPVSNFFGNFPSVNPFPSKSPLVSPTVAPSASPTSPPAGGSSPIPAPIVGLEILDIEPTSANFMQEFTLEGTNFGTTPGSVSFRYYTNSFSAAGAAIVSWSDSEIKAKVPGVKKGSYRIQVITSENKKSNEVKFSVKNGQPFINTTSLHHLDNEYELTFQGTEFGSRRGSIDIYLGSDLVGNGVIEYWSNSRVRFTIPNIPFQEYGFQLTTSDGRKSSFKFFTVGN